MSRILCIDKKILELMTMLLALNLVESESEFSVSIGLKKQNLINIKKGINHFTPIHIENICKIYNVNANWIFETEKNVFKKNKSIEKNGV